ncbi:MAG: chemotaxis protein CheW [Holophagales bacterium]|nr:chemotaxis protein CheW [Holophagales bacterium]
MTLSRVLAFRAAGVACAADPADVERILRPDGLLPVPGAPDWIAGLVAGPRGLLAVIDVGRRLFPSHEGRPPRDLLAGTFDGVPAALGADEVEGILPVTADEVPPPEGLSPGVAACLKGVVVAGGERRLLLDVRRLVAGDVAVAGVFEVVEAATRAAGQIGSVSAERRDQSS